MGIAADTVLASITGAQAALTAATIANGDSANVRNFPATGAAYLEGLSYAATTKGSVQVRSPRLHDDVRGIQMTPGESPSHFLLPREIAQVLYPGDNLTVEMSGCLAAETDVLALHVYYTDLPGISARLRSWGDISGLVKNIKVLEVDAPAPGAAGTWADTVINATEDLLRANEDYAVLGYLLDVGGGVVGIRGTDTGNLRICGPATTATDDTSDYFVRLSALTGRPHIPVINASNKGNTFVTVGQPTALAAQKVQLVLAELSQNV